jgi:hypothetical protein
MVAWNQVTRADILHAISEFDRLGQDRFFAEYGFGPAKRYVLAYGNRRYDSKAILGAAYKFATGQGLGSGDFEGGKSGAAAVLRKLGFAVYNVQGNAGDAPRGPGRPGRQDDPGAKRSRGARILDGFRAGLSRDDIARCLADYAAVTGYDASLRQLRRAAPGGLDLRDEAHRAAVTGWLRAWGCRHLRRADDLRTTTALGAWWDARGGELPGRRASLTGLGEAELSGIERVYDALRDAPAAARSLKDRDIDVAFGDTAAAKVMYAVRPDVFLPWDAPIRQAFGWHGGGAAYAELLRLSRSALLGLARRLAVPVGDLPEILGRPGSSPPKLVDEFLWIKVTREL